MPSEQLKRYRAKRDFRKTKEPSGKGKRRRRKKREARNLHYDFRLEVDGVLKSWAVPKGPSTDPREKRLAVEVEDHPLDYGDFEGVLGEGYGAGAVIVWDAGTWRPLTEGDPTKALRDGHLSFWLEGKKLRGGFTLQRTRGGE